MSKRIGPTTEFEISDRVVFDYCGKVLHGRVTKAYCADLYAVSSDGYLFEVNASKDSMKLDIE